MTAKFSLDASMYSKKFLQEQLNKVSSEGSMYSSLISNWIEKVKSLSVNQKEKDKRILELYHFASFVIGLKYSNTISDIQEITISNLSVEPDFVISFKGARIGLEVRRVLNENAQKIGERKKILSLSAKIFEMKYSDIKLLANIGFTDDFDERKNNSDIVKSQIADFIYCYYCGLKVIKPDFIESFQCMKHSKVNFELTTTYTVGVLDAEIIQAIKDKDEKLIKYKAKSQLKKVWLLLVVSGASGDSDFSYLDPANINCDNSFDAVFLLNDFKKEVYFLTKEWDKE